jgi:hypothetical protein
MPLDQNLFRNWIDGDTFSARDYVYERSLIITTLNTVVNRVDSLSPDLANDLALLDVRYYQKYILDADFNSDRNRLTVLESLTDQAVLQTSNVLFNNINVSQDLIVGDNAAITGDLTVNNITANDITAADVTSTTATIDNLTITTGDISLPGYESISTTLSTLSQNKVDKLLSQSFYPDATLGIGTGALQQLYIDNNGSPSRINLNQLRSYIAADFASFSFIVSTADANGLPDVPESERFANKVYLVALDNPEGPDDIYTEYLWLDDDWEFIGTTDVDLDNYYNKAEVLDLLGNKALATNTFYVDVNGDDDDGDGSLLKPFATIRHACEVTAALPPAGFGAFGPIRPLTSIQIASGQYYEQLPIVVPTNTALIGADLRTVQVYPLAGLSDDGVTPNNQSQMFQMSSGTLAMFMALYGMTGWVKPASVTDNPEDTVVKGVGFALNPASAIFGPSPYILDCSAFFPGGVGAYVDGDVHAISYINLELPSSPPWVYNATEQRWESSVLPIGAPVGNRSMLFYAYTNINDNGVGFWADNGGVMESVSNFTYYASYGYLATRGGYLRGLNGSNSWGDWALYARGYLPSETPITGELRGTMIEYSNLTSAFQIGQTMIGATSGAEALILNVQAGSNALFIERTTTETFIDNEDITTETGSAKVLGSEFGQKGALLVVTNLTGEPEPRQGLAIDGDELSYVVATVSGTFVDATSTMFLTLANNKPESSPADTTFDLRKRYSQIRVTGHDFLNVGTGGIASITIGGGTLINPGTPPVQAQQVGEFDTGRVFSVSTDQDGNFRVGKFFAIDQGTGRATLDASAFDLSGLTTLRLGSIGAQLGEAINEFSSDPLLTQNSNEKVPTQFAIKTYVDTAVNTLTQAIDNVNVNNIVGDLTLEDATETYATTLSVEDTGLNLTGNVVIDGNLTVSGTETILNTETLNIEDKNIVLGNVDTPTDTTANGGGITLKGTTDKQIVYSETGNKWEVVNADLYVGRMSTGPGVNPLPGELYLIEQNEFGGGSSITYTSRVRGTYVDDFITVPTTGWSDTSGAAPYTRVVGSLFMEPSMSPIVDIDMDRVAFADLEDILTAWALIYRISAGDGEMTVYAKEIPEIAIPLKARA